MKQVLKNLIGKLGYSIERVSKGSNPYETQKKLVSNPNPTIFDVGAYDGRVSLHYNQIFSDSNIFAFEPFTKSFLTLKNTVSSYNNISIYNLALSSSKGKKSFFINASHATNSLFTTHKDSSNYWNKDLLETTEEIKVDVTTLDQFCEENDIPYIDILKLDVQGGEYNVLSGATELLKRKKIKMIYMEIILVPTYTEQKEFLDYLNFFSEYGYKLSNMHDLVRNNTNLLQLDALFISK